MKYTVSFEPYTYKLTNCLSILRSTIITKQSVYVRNQRRKKKVFYTVLKRHCGQYVRVIVAKTLKKIFRDYRLNNNKN